MDLITTVISTLSKGRFNVTNEKETQAQIALALKAAGFTFSQEYRLDPANIPDFFIEGIAIEVKIKGNSKKIYKQVERYSLFSEVKVLILVTNRSMGFPQEVNGKPVYLVNLGKAWL